MENTIVYNAIVSFHIIALILFQFGNSIPYWKCFKGRLKQCKIYGWPLVDFYMHLQTNEKTWAIFLKIYISKEGEKNHSKSYLTSSPLLDNKVTQIFHNWEKLIMKIFILMTKYLNIFICTI